MFACVLLTQDQRNTTGTQRREREREIFPEGILFASKRIFEHDTLTFLFRPTRVVLSSLPTLSICSLFFFTSFISYRFLLTLSSKINDVLSCLTQVLSRWILSVKRNYRPVIYHNWRHSLNVTQTMFAMLMVCTISFTFHFRTTTTSSLFLLQISLISSLHPSLFLLPHTDQSQCNDTIELISTIRFPSPSSFPFHSSFPSSSPSHSSVGSNVSILFQFGTTVPSHSLFVP